MAAEPTENDFAMLSVSFHKVAEAHEALTVGVDRWVLVRQEWGRAIFAHTQAREARHRRVCGSLAGRATFPWAWGSGFFRKSLH